MNKLTLFLILIAIVLYSCGGTETAQESTSTESALPSTEQQPKTVATTVDDSPNLVMAGTWKGEMNNKKLTMVLEEVKGKELVGYNILGDNKRALKGSFIDGAWDQPCSKAYEATLNEPGDDKWDGVFTIKFVGYEDTSEGDDLECLGNLKGFEAMGVWKSNNGKSEKSFSLERE